MVACLFLIATLFGACAQADPSSPEPVARSYAAAWSRGDYRAMWDLLTEEARSRVGEEGFLERLPLIAEEMSLASLEARVGAVSMIEPAADSPDPLRASIRLIASFRTSRVGDFERETTIELVREGSAPVAVWRVDWRPEAILPGLAQGRLVRMTRIPTSRGRIIARDGSELASFSEATVVGIVPGNVRDLGATSASLAPIVGLTAAQVRDRLAQPWVRPDLFVPIKTMTPDAATRQSLALIEGVATRAERVRSYPSGLAAQTIGYVGEATDQDAERKAARGVAAGDVIGQTGLEATLDDLIGGSYGWRLSIVDPNEQPVDVIAETAPVPGDDAVLALDPVLQRAAEQALGDQKGSIVAEDPWTGEILAIASRPSFDLNAFVTGDVAAITRFNADPNKPVFNRATFGQYPTGSSFKPVTAAAALRSGLYRSGEIVDCPFRWTGYGPSWVQINHETADLGPITLRTALSRSCNSFFYELGKRLNDRAPDLLPNAAKSFGFGSATDIEFVLEAAGLVPSPAWKQANFQAASDKVWNPGDATNLAIGQGFLLATPLQMANYAAVLANDGIVWQPRLVTELRDRAGQTVKTYEKKQLRAADATATELSLIRDGLRAVVTDTDGTVYFPFRGFELAVAGKSGTAETTSGDPDAWFVGFAPFDAPRIAFATLYEEKPGLLGSQDAAAATRLMLAAKFGGTPRP